MDCLKIRAQRPLSRAFLPWCGIVSLTQAFVDQLVCSGCIEPDRCDLRGCKAVLLLSVDLLHKVNQALAVSGAILSHDTAILTHLSAGVAAKMSKELPFLNIALPNHPHLMHDSTVLNILGYLSYIYTRTIIIYHNDTFLKHHIQIISTCLEKHSPYLLFSIIIPP